ncbi:anti sigma factor C-terminal domain-containing protein [Desulfotomaculum sp. 1211_IL3151]|uniref:anti sigma factor C-terminal domain-containing protein n=1 Tax=Desulfotomaculum sp. 1211_IL3151 TaxID=3084055 RepID=UPI002FDB3CBE
MNKNQLNSQEQNDEEELDSLFFVSSNNKLRRAIKKAKWHSILRNVLISILVIVVLFIGGSIANRGINYRLEGPVQIAVDNFNEISAPNKYVGRVSRYHEILGGRNEYTTYKIIEGKIVYSGEGDYSYGLFRNEWGNRIGTSSPLILGNSFDAGDLDMQRYNELGQREMVFFYPFISYPKYKNDLLLLNNIGSDKVMEMALSFDKDYSIDEVNNMLPDNVTLSWYWVDDLSGEEKEASKLRKEKQQDSEGTTQEVDYPARIRSERTVYGIKAYDGNGEPQEDPVQNFIWAFKNGGEHATRFKSEFERVYRNIAGEDGNLTKEDIRVLGAVVTGDVDRLNTLHNLPFIKASSLGVVTEKY